MIEDLDDVRFEAFLKSRRYSEMDRNKCFNFIYKELHGTCADIFKADAHTLIESILSEPYRSQNRRHKARCMYIHWLQDFLRKEAAA